MYVTVFLLLFLFDMPAHRSRARARGLPRTRSGHHLRIRIMAASIRALDSAGDTAKKTVGGRRTPGGDPGGGGAASPRAPPRTHEPGHGFGDTRLVETQTSDRLSVQTDCTPGARREDQPAAARRRGRRDPRPPRPPEAAARVPLPKNPKHAAHGLSPRTLGACIRASERRARQLVSG